MGISLLLLVLPMATATLEATYMITPRKPLFDNAKLISADGTFSLNFIAWPGSQNLYLGLWYTYNVSIHRLVWIANQEPPAVVSSASLNLSSSGTLYIFDTSSDTVVWSFVCEAVRNPVVRLLDSGSLVISDKDDTNPAGYTDVCVIFDNTYTMGNRNCGPFGINQQRGIDNCTCIRGFSQTLPYSWEMVRGLRCLRDTALRCSSSGSTDVFYEMNDMRLPYNSQNLTTAISKDKCEMACLKSCSCMAYSFNNICLLCYETLINLEQLDYGTGDTLYIRLADTEIPISRRKRDFWRSRGSFIVASSCAAAVCFGAYITSLVVVHKLVPKWKLRMKAHKFIGMNLVLFSYSELTHITKDFSEKLGGGGFGSVYKGVLLFKNSSIPVAVKKLEGVYQGDKQFRAEVRTIGVIQHTNLIRLRGFCSNETKKLLVYDFMPNGSLAYQLFQNKDTVLDWNTRYQIALGTARGLAYLHENCRDRIIHCDIKPENILLDSSFGAKVADFGLAKLVNRDFSRVLTTMRGTIGYLAPEWISGVAITAKADVYSYGLMLFEIVSGNRNWGSEGKSLYFPYYAACKLQESENESEILGLLDRRLDGVGDVKGIVRVCKVACWCIQDDENVRPTMGQVVQILEGLLEVGVVPPIPRTLRMYAENTISCSLDPEGLDPTLTGLTSVISSSKL